MKQLITIYKDGTLRLEDVPVPKARKGFVVVRNAYSVVSTGTEIMKIRNAEKSLLGKAMERPEQVKQVMETAKQLGVKAAYKKVVNRLTESNPLGYSCSGVVEEVGEGVNFKQGQWVSCGGADFANHAEYVLVPKNLCVPLPEGVDPAEAAFSTIGAIALHGIRLAEVSLGETVAAIGLGLLGLLSLQILHAAGCNVVGLDIDDRRVQRGLSLGAMTAVNIRHVNPLDIVQQHTQGMGADVVIITAGGKSNDPIELAAEIARDRARIVDVGIIRMNVPWKSYYEKELSLVMSRSYGPGRYDDAYEIEGRDYPIGYVRWTEHRNMTAFLDLIQKDRIHLGKLITHRFPFTQCVEVLKEISRNPKDEDFLGVIFEYSRDDEKKFETPHRVHLSTSVPGLINIGVIGAGNFVKTMILPNINHRKDVSLVGLATIRGISSKNTAEKFGFAYCTTNSDEVISDNDINAVIIGTRHDSHAGLTLAALKAGKHVFAEKPLAMNPEELQDIKDFFQETKTPPLLMVGYNRRFSKAACTLKEFFQPNKGPMMMLYRINAGSLEPNSWYLHPEQGGGRIIGEVCHFVDLFQFLTESEVISVTASFLDAPPSSHLYQEDVCIQLNFGNGSVGAIIYTSQGEKKFPKERIEVFSEGRVGILENFNTVELWAKGKKKTTKCRHDKGHREGINAFINCVKKSESPPINLDSLFHTSEVIFAVKEACTTRHRVDLK